MKLGFSAKLAATLDAIGLLTQIDRTVLASYCQADGRWVETEKKLAETPMLLKTPAGYVQQSPWLTISNKQVELMTRLMAEMGLTPGTDEREPASSSAEMEASSLPAAASCRRGYYTHIETLQGHRDRTPSRGEGGAALTAMLD